MVGLTTKATMLMAGGVGIMSPYFQPNYASLDSLGIDENATGTLQVLHKLQEFQFLGGDYGLVGGLFHIGLFSSVALGSLVGRLVGWLVRRLTCAYFS